MTRERGGRREGSYGIGFALPDAGRKLEFEPKAKGQGPTQTQISQRRSLTGRPNEVKEDLGAWKGPLSEIPF